MLMRYSILFATLFLLVSFAPPETPALTKLRYKVLKDGKAIGEIKASQIIQGGQIVYEVQTEMNVKVVLSQRISYTSKAVYEDGVLQHANSKSYFNDKLHSTCITTLKGNRYWVTTDKDEFYVNRTITYSGVMLYFREPGSTTTVYSEMSGQDNTMRKTGNGQYVLTNSKSKKQNRYWYRGGILDHASINHTLLDLEIQRVN